MQLSSNSTHFFVNQLMWNGIPLSLVVIVETFLLLSFYISRMLSRMDTLNSSIVERMLSLLSSDRGWLKYYSMSAARRTSKLHVLGVDQQWRLGLSTYLNDGIKDINLFIWITTTCLICIAENGSWAYVKVIQSAILYNRYKDLILFNKNIIVAGICSFFWLHLLPSFIIHNTTKAI